MIAEDAKVMADELDRLADGRSDSLGVLCTNAALMLRIMGSVIEKTRVNSQDFANLPAHLTRLRLQNIWEQIALTEFSKCERCDKLLEGDDIDGGRCTNCGTMLCPKYAPFIKHEISDGLRKFFEAEIRNEDHGGDRPATLGSAWGSFMQMDVTVLQRITGLPKEQIDRVALAHELDGIRRTESDNTLLREFL